MARRNLALALSLSALLFFHHAFCSATPAQNLNLEAEPGEEEEDLSFLQEDDTESSVDSYPGGLAEGKDEEDGDDGEFEYPEPPEFDDKDVVVLGKGNFSVFVGQNPFVMVEFYAPWCGHCQNLAPEYAAAATELKGEVALAKVDATEESELAEEFQVQGLPTLIFLSDGARKLFRGHRNKDGIVAWIRKQTVNGAYNVTSTDDAEKILKDENRVVLGFFDSLVGRDSQELAAASKLDDDVNFYQTDNPDVAQLFHIDPKAKRPVLVLLKRDDEKQSFFEGRLTKSAIHDFVIANKLPLVTPFTHENAPLISDHPIRKQVLLFATANDSNEVLPIFQEAAKPFKGKVVGYNDLSKYKFDGDITSERLKDFGKSFIEGKLKSYYKSDPIPQTNDEDVKIVVGYNFEETVLDESKDVLLEIYAPWCEHCKALEPTYNRLAKFVRGVDSLVIAKMDGTTNEHPKAMIDVETDRKAVSLYKFIKKHASIPFETPKKDKAAVSEEKSEEDVQERSQRDDAKDEL
ncbi:Protein disulfide isomerase-like [Asimina triloba]